MGLSLPQAIPAPTTTSLGGVRALAATAKQFLTGIGMDGVPVAAQPAATDVSGLGTAATKDVGTAAGNLVQLDGATGHLPAVDGRNLTNLPAGPAGEGQIGTYAYAYSASAVSFGTTYPGSSLQPAAMGSSGTVNRNGSLLGTWRAMGSSNASSPSTTLFLRVA